MFANAVHSTKIHKAFSSFRGLAVRKGGAKVDLIKKPKDFTAFRADKHCRFEVTNLESSPEATCLLDGKVEVEHCIAGCDQGVIYCGCILNLCSHLGFCTFYRHFESTGYPNNSQATCQARRSNSTTSEFQEEDIQLPKASIPKRSQPVAEDYGY